MSWLTRNTRSARIVEPGVSACSASAACRLRADLTEQGAVGAERRLAAKVSVKHGGVPADLAAGGQADQASHGLSLIDGVEDDALQSAQQPDRVESRLVRDAVIVAGPAGQDGDLLLAQVAAEPDELCRVAGDLLDLGAGLLELGRGVDPGNRSAARQPLTPIGTTL